MEMGKEDKFPTNFEQKIVCVQMSTRQAVPFIDEATGCSKCDRLQVASDDPRRSPTKMKKEKMLFLQCTLRTVRSVVVCRPPPLSPLHQISLREKNQKKNDW